MVSKVVGLLFPLLLCDVVLSVSLPRSLRGPVDPFPVDPRTLPSDFSRNQLRDEMKFTRNYVANPQQYWSDANRHGRSQPLSTVSNPYRSHSLASAEVYREPSTGYEAPEHIKQAIYRERKFIGPFLGVGADLTVPSTRGPDFLRSQQIRGGSSSGGEAASSPSTSRSQIFTAEPDERTKILAAESSAGPPPDMPSDSSNGLSLSDSDSSGSSGGDGAASSDSAHRFKEHPRPADPTYGSSEMYERLMRQNELSDAEKVSQELQEADLRLHVRTDGTMRQPDAAPYTPVPFQRIKIPSKWLIRPEQSDPLAQTPLNYGMEPPPQ